MDVVDPDAAPDPRDLTAAVRRIRTRRAGTGTDVWVVAFSVAGPLTVIPVGRRR